jgi:putative oxidoreductase
MATASPTPSARARAPLLVSTPSADAGRLLLRLTLGGLILLHGIAKLTGGPGFVMEALSKAGLPGFIGYLVYVGEVLAPLLLIVGAWTRPAAAVIAINMLVAVGLVHVKQIASLNDTGGWAIELQAIYFASAVAIALLGAGRYSVAGAQARWN